MGCFSTPLTLLDRCTKLKYNFINLTKAMCSLRVLFALNLPKIIMLFVAEFGHTAYALFRIG